MRTPSGRRFAPWIWAALGGVLLLVVGTGAAALMRGGSAEGGAAEGSLLSNPGDYGTLPDFDLIERSGRSVSRQDLGGSFWVADFIFTRCTGSCPILTARMASLRSAASKLPGGSNVRFVSFSVDPAWDTPDVLSRYAAVAGGGDGPPAGEWLFLTGSRQDLHRLIGEGFRLSVAERPPDPLAPGEMITHSDRFVLIDPDGRIRGYYHGTDQDSVEKLIADLARLLVQSAH